MSIKDNIYYISLEQEISILKDMEFYDALSEEDRRVVFHNALVMMTHNANYYEKTMEALDRTEPYFGNTLHKAVSSYLNTNYQHYPLHEISKLPDSWGFDDDPWEDDDEYGGYDYV